ncbi:hypothetical protein [Facklamia miroungae]|uniref:Uncharacterized protein n=1 Tax=Facklamia miroungae TaxID=120956 RepID=A0A1G7SIP7_9LACT|nr:hypothetical protein [Facklamia miroungae]NKZ29638.1 hypothetical protein [Facklamia miroungae]SDG22873.1 hypothetical protein SAMN05421791_10439 [Facklamia miroungae]
MKKIIGLILTLLLLTGCQLSKYFQEPQPSENNEITELTSTSKDPVTKNSDREPNEENVKLDHAESSDLVRSKDTFLNERVISPSKYPKLSFADDVPQDINQAMENFYLNKFTEREQKANQSKIKDSDLELILSQINHEDDLKGLNVYIDQVQFLINDSIIYVPRIIVPTNFAEAEKLAEENDTRLLNHALTQLGNRLVLLAYYDQETDTLIPMHLVNSTHSLFFSQP